MVGGYKATGSMRLASQDNPFSERKNKSGLRIPKSQYIIFAEGAETEKLYFESLSRSNIKKESVIIKYLDRWKVNSGRSNQLCVVNDVIDYVEKIRVEKSIDPKKTENIFNKLVENVKIEEFPGIIDELEKLITRFPVFFNPEESIQPQLQSYNTLANFDFELDKIFIILDRDYRSFTKGQFDEVLAKAHENKINLGITNPCFEFFLLLHFNEICDVDTNKLLENKKTGKKTYVEKKLNEYLKRETRESFKKNSYNAKFFISNVKIALKNAEKYEIENTKLENNVGSSVVSIIKEIIG